MELITSIIIFTLFTGGFYLILQKNLFEVVLGIVLLSHGVNVLLISMSGWKKGAVPPILEKSESGELITQASHYVDPLPQALILTAIVIGLALTSFVIVLTARTFAANGTLEAGELPSEEPAE